MQLKSVCLANYVSVVIFFSHGFIKYHVADIADLHEESFLTVSSYLTSGSGEMPTVDTIDSYMNRLHSIILANPQDNENFIATVREVVNRLDR